MSQLPSRLNVAVLVVSVVLMLLGTAMMTPHLPLVDGQVSLAEARSDPLFRWGECTFWLSTICYAISAVTYLIFE